MQATVHELFPTPVVVFNLGRDFTKEEREWISSYDDKLSQSRLNRSTKADRVLNDAPAANLKKFIHDRMNDYFKHVYQPDCPVSCYITQSWINHTKGGEAHHQHYHGNAFVSGCMYVDVEEGDCIHFYSRDFADRWYEIPTKNYNKYNSQSWWIPVKKGDMLFWPANVPHEVQNLAEDRKSTRITLAYNGFIKGTLGHGENSPTLYLSGEGYD